MRTFPTAAAVVALLVASPALAQQNQTAPTAQPQAQTEAPAAAGQQQAQGQLSQQDRQFVEQAAISDMLEKELGEKAQDKAENEQVKQFGERMAQDHDQSSESLKTLLEQANADIELPDDLPDAEQQKADRLDDMDGQQFDQAYMQMMVDEHERALELFRQQAQQGEHDQLKQFAEAQIPTLEQHHREAQDLLQQVGGAQAQADAGATGATGAAGGAAGGTAATTTAQQQGQDVGQMQDTQAASATPTRQDLMGKSVYGQNGDQIGEVSDVVISTSDDSVERIVIDRGGFLGIGQTSVALDINDVQITAEGIRVNLTDEQVSELPEWEGTDDDGTVNRNQTPAGDTAPPATNAPPATAN